MEEKSDLEEMKENYLKIQEKYFLPSFEELNKDFSIEKIAEEETDLLLREVRKYIADKFSTYLRFIEGVLHPMNAPMFVFSVVKTLSKEDKEKLTDIYKKLAKREVDLLELDIDFKEEKEAEFIKNSFEEWQEIKEDLLKIVGSIKKNWDNKVERNGAGYFG